MQVADWERVLVPQNQDLIDRMIALGIKMDNQGSLSTKEMLMASGVVLAGLASGVLLDMTLYKYFGLHLTF